MRIAFRAGIPFLALLALAACGAPADVVPDIVDYAVVVETEGEGSVVSVPQGVACGTTCTARFDSGSTVVLRAEPAEGHRFAGWGGACANAVGSSCTLTLNHDARLSAAFEPVPLEPPEPDPGDTDPPPADEPPADEPPADEPPADEPPADEPPTDEPPADEPPADEPPADEPPADEPPADEPTAILVTSDSGGTGGPDCTLRDAITAANTDASAGGCPAGSGADVIRLGSGLTVTLDEPHVADADGDGPVGLPPVTSEIEILAEGATIERSSTAPPFRILTVAAGGDLILRNATLRGGSGRADEAPGDRGFVGAGVLNRGTLVLNEVVLRENLVDRPDTTFDGFDPPAPFGAGGGLFNEGDATLRDTSVLGNDALRGGGIYNAQNARLRLIRSTVGRNEAWGHGAGVATWGELEAVNSTISRNFTHDGFGSALYLYTDEDADTTTGLAGTAELEHVSLVANGGTYTSGAIETVGPARVSLRGVLISANTTDPSGVQVACDGRGRGDFVSLGRNVVAGSLDSDPSDCGLGANDVAITDTDPDDGHMEDADASPLADNGGPTETNALAPSSPAVDLIPASECTLPRDQRDVERPQGEGCDAGAFERE